jgi:hypothetical protein
MTRILALEAHDWRVLAEGVWWLVALRAALWVVPVRRLAPWCGRVHATTGAGARARHVDVERLVRLLEAVARRIPGTACLPRSLALTRMLAVRGIASDLRMGVRAEHGRLTAHAWVERLGQPINDAPGVRNEFDPLDVRLEARAK